MPNWAKIVNRTDPLQGWRFQGNNRYTVAKLKDGKCWMTQNLRLGKDEPITLTSETTDTISEYILPARIKKFASSNDANAIYYDDTAKNTNGVYYSWRTATAGKGTTSITTGDIDVSICPKNWDLPTKSIYQNLARFYNNNSSGELLKEPVNIIMSGIFYGGGDCNNGTIPCRIGSCGTFYSSTSEASGMASCFNVYNSSLQFCGIDGNWSKANGLSIRCISK